MRVMKSLSIFIVGNLLFFLILSAQAKEYQALPDFTQTSPHEWFNSKPLTKKDLLGKVTLIDFWTFECWNCYRSFPWLHGVEEAYKAKGLQVIGVHTPEFEREKNHASINTKIKQFGIHYPVMVDNDRAYWKAMKNRYWPAYYLVDKKGKIRASFIGETHKDTAQASKIEALIEKLLSEPFDAAQEVGFSVGF